MKASRMEAARFVGFLFNVLMTAKEPLIVRILHRNAPGDGDKKCIPFLGSTRKRVPCAVEGKPAAKRRVKRCCHSLPNRDEGVGGQGEGRMHVYFGKPMARLTFHR